MVILQRACWLAFVVLWVHRGTAAQPVAAGKVEFDRDIRPILSDTCFHCHGPDSAKRKADLRLDTEQGAKGEVDGRFPIVPGDLAKSEVYRRITSTDPDEQMPPPNSLRSVTPQQVELIKRWIEQGAQWEQHWAYVAPRRPALPVVKDAAWVRHPIDAFVLARLEAEGLAPSPEASNETLIRRATLDLTGLPPTPAEVDAFLADASPNAYEELVDRLLDAPAYGEHMAREWLDAARYADSNGYQQDLTRTMWPWRDWLIGALNANMPFDRFTTEMLAGDLLAASPSNPLPDATVDQHIASGFNRNHALNGEGGRIPEESRVEYVVDRVETTSTIWLGLTLGCSRCHDHKYDPFLQKEFYQLYAYFNNIDETGAVDAGGNANPVLRLPTDQQQKQIEEVTGQIAELNKQVAARAASLAQTQADWERRALERSASNDLAPVWTAARPGAVAAQNGTTLVVLDDHSVLAGGENPAKEVYTVTLPIELPRVTGLRVEALTHESLPADRPGRDPSGVFVLTELEVEQVLGAGAPPVAVKIADAQPTFEQAGFPITAAFDGQRTSGWAVGGDKEKQASAEFAFEQPIAGGAGLALTIRLRHESPRRQQTLGRFRLSFTADEEPLRGKLPDAVAAALRVPAGQRSPEQAKAIAEHHQARDSSLRAVRVQLAHENERLKALNQAVLTMMVMRERAEPRVTHLLVRGAYDKYGEPVAAGTPAVLHPLPKDAPANRLGLARWITDPANPLTARVTVNRYWQSFFGTGLVKTAEDFGVQGEKPSHRELLDWLATEFIRGGWDVKAMHRLIVTSAAYRQASDVTPGLLERDPANRLLARGPRHRLSSFQLRDQALAISGLLTPIVGGAPIKPYQPPGLWEELSFNVIKYEQDHGPSLYRRSIYTFWRRTLGPTMMFDTANRQVCVVKQPRTNTPLQSLILLNEPGYLEAARVFAERLLSDNAGSDPDRVIAAFRTATARRPDDKELALLLQSLQRLRREYQAGPERSRRAAPHG